MQRESIERGTQRLAVRERVGLEGGMAAQPLGPSRRRLTRDRRGGQIAFGIALTVRFDAILVDPE
jgi:hypothetical protein